MGRKYTRISIDVDFDDISDSISSKDLLSEIATRILDSEEQLQLKDISDIYFKGGEFENLDLNLIQEMKLRYLLEIIDKYSLDQIETALPK